MTVPRRDRAMAVLALATTLSTLRSASAAARPVSAVGRAAAGAKQPVQFIAQQRFGRTGLRRTTRRGRPIDGGRADQRGESRSHNDGQRPGAQAVGAVNVLCFLYRRRAGRSTGMSGNVAAEAEREHGLDDQIEARQERQCCGRIAPGWRRRCDAEANRDCECQQHRGERSRRKRAEHDRRPLQETRRDIASRRRRDVFHRPLHGASEGRRRIELPESRQSGRRDR